MAAVGVIGLGDIGRGIASSLPSSGFDLVVYDLLPSATASFDRVADDPADLASQSDALVVAVATDAQVLNVLSEVVESLHPGSTVVVISTVALSTLRSAAALVERAGAAVVDCGVSGGPSAAAAGELVSMIGGDKDAVERALPVIEAFSSLVVRMGPLGAGLRAKLARNVVQYGSWFAAFEAQRLAEAAGIELSKLATVIRESDKHIGGASRLMFRDTTAPFGPEDDAGIVGAMRAGAALALKDLRAAVTLADELGIELPMTMLAESQIESVFGVPS